MVLDRFSSLWTREKNRDLETLGTVDWWRFGTEVNDEVGLAWVPLESVLGEDV